MIEKGKTEIERACEKHGKYLAKQMVTLFGKGAIYQQCPKCLEEYREEEKKRLEKEAKERAIEAQRRFIDKLIERGCGNEYIKKRNSLGYQTQLLSKQLPNGKLLYDLLRIENGDFANQENLLLLGSCGIGKTFFACRMVEEALRNGKNYIILAGFELISIYQNSTKNGVLRINSAENLEDRLESVDGLIIDEIDFFLRDSRTAKEKEVLEIVAHYTSKNGIRTIALGNCKADELGALDSKVLSRLASGLVLNGWGMQDLRLAKC